MWSPRVVFHIDTGEHLPLTRSFAGSFPHTKGTSASPESLTFVSSPPPLSFECRRRSFPPASRRRGGTRTRYRCRITTAQRASRLTVLIFDPPTATRCRMVFFILRLRIQARIIHRRALTLLRASFCQTTLAVTLISRANSRRRRRALDHKASRTCDSFFGASSSTFVAKAGITVAVPKANPQPSPACSSRHNDHQNPLTSINLNHLETGEPFVGSNDPFNISNHHCVHTIH
ncbi:hypothetical protein BDZ89DRAFT_1165850 [Hymenopellis radicata]|nr:hypothetical protein BDZ89DRAFT_1165850 [Hymenopellis radicata]